MLEITKPTFADFLAGGGEMGALMRATDWSSTPVGPVEAWPQSLRTAISILLESKFGTMVAWGPELTHFHNDAYRPILGDSKHPSQGKRVADVFPEIWESFIKPLFDGVRQGKAVGFENLLVPLHRNGFLEEIYFTFSYNPIRDESSGIGGIFVTVSETTASVVEERRLRLLNALAEVTTSQSPSDACAAAAAEIARAPADVPFALFYLLDETGAATLAGAANLEHGGPMSPATIEPGAQAPWPLARVQEEALFVPLQRAPVAARGAVILPLESSGRRFGFAVLGLAPMIPASASYARFHKLVAASLSRSVSSAAARDEAAAARQRLHAQLMQAPVAVSVVSGPRFLVTLANARYEELVGRNATQMRGRPFRDLFPELPNDAPVFQMMEEVLRSGEPFNASEYRVAIARHGRIEDVYFLFTCQPIRDDLGKVTEIMTVAVDVTAQVLARQRIETLMRELQEAGERKDEFLATLAHELRNPMAAISMALALLEQTGSDAAKSTRHREIAQRQVRNLVRLVDDLLDVSRITRGLVELRKEQVDLRAVVNNAVAAARVSLDSRNHQVAVTVSPGNYLLLADPTRLEQVMTNLLTNAAKYTEPGGLVSVGLAAEKELAVLRVRDTGRGIPPEMLNKVFDMFVQVQQTIDRSKGGLGLGLTLVKRLVELHGGTVTAHSEGEGKGSEFVVRLPMPKVPAPVQHPAASIDAAPVSRRILLIEDSEDIRETLAEFFEELGHEVTVAANGPDGVAKALALLPDVAFIDVGLPGIDGYEVARRVRAGPGGKELYLIALTGYGGAEAVRTAADAGFDLHLTKPVDVATLPRLINRGKR